MGAAGTKGGSPWKKFWSRVRLLFSGSDFLCDTCRYNYGNVCTRPERPNAVNCPDYKK